MIRTMHFSPAPPYSSGRGLTITRAGINVRHDEDLVIDRPRGVEEEYIFVNFTTAIVLHDATGTRIRQPHTCILLEPGFHQYYRGVTGGFDHHWLHFTGDQAPGLVKDSRIPVNTAFRPADTSFVEPLVHDMLSEIVNRTQEWELAVELLLRLFFIRLSRSIAEGSPRAASLTLRDRLAGVRQEMLGSLDHPWSVPELAAKAFLSASRFTALYRRAFHVSPKEDLINARMQNACWLLRSKGGTVEDIALQCGFVSVNHFSRLFHRRIGVPPGRYARTG